MSSFIDLFNILPARLNESQARELSKITMFVIHSIDAENWTPQKLNALCTGIDATPDDFTDDLKNTRQEPVCSYHDYIRSNGDIYHMVDYNIVTWHARLWNTKSIGVALEYKPSLENKPPATAMMEQLKQYLAVGCLAMGISPRDIVGHRELLNTGFIIKNGRRVQLKSCPGNAIDLRKLRDDVMFLIGSSYDKINDYAFENNRQKYINS